MSYVGGAASAESEAPCIIASNIEAHRLSGDFELAAVPYVKSWPLSANWFFGSLFQLSMLLLLNWLFSSVAPRIDEVLYVAFFLEMYFYIPQYWQRFACICTDSPLWPMGLPPAAHVNRA